MGKFQVEIIKELRWEILRRRKKTRSSYHGLGEAGVAFAEAELTEGISRAPVHAPVPGKHQLF